MSSNRMPSLLTDEPQKSSGTMNEIATQQFIQDIKDVCQKDRKLAQRIFEEVKPMLGFCINKDEEACPHFLTSVCTVEKCKFRV